MKAFIIVLILINFIVLGCSKTIDINPSESFSGALDSCVLYISPNIFNSDSGVYSGHRNQIYKFGYDEQHRVVKMTGEILGINVSDLSMLFYYNGTSKNPYLIKDSTFSGAYYRVRKYYLKYDNNDRVIIDSIVGYRYNQDGTINSGSISKNVYQFNYVSNYMTYENTQFPLGNNRDTTYFNSTGDEIRTVNTYNSYSGFNYSSFEYHTVENPFYKLNVRKALYRLVGFYWAALPDGAIHLVQPKYLFKKLSGYYYFGIWPWEKRNVYSNCYYETTSSGQVDRITMITYENQANISTWVRTDVASIRFFYHQ